ncbi:MAG: AsmA family protein [Burkholderiales bacterium]|nr:AsmA family protein [Burkholderiales bacterium]
MAADLNSARRSRWSWGRVLGIFLGVVALLLGALYLVVVFAFPPERLAAMLSEQVKAATGRTLRVDGGLSIRLLPTIAVHARDIAFANAEWGSRPEMLKVRDAAFEVSLRALLDGELHILRIDVEGVDALLESDGAGHANWQFAPAAPPVAKPSAAASDGGGSGLALDRLVASDVKVVYRDKGKPPAPTLAIDTLDIQARDQGDEIAATFAVGPRRWKVTGKTGRGVALLEGRSEWPFDLQLGTDGATLAAKGTLVTKPKVLLVADVSAPVIDLARLGLVAASPTPAPARAKAPLFGDTPLPFDAVPAIDLRLGLRVGSLKVPGAPPISDLQARLSSTPGKVLLEELQFAVAAGQAHGRGELVLAANAPPRLDVSLEAKALSLQALDAASGGGDRIRGGRADVALNLAATGRTPRALAASTQGKFLFSAADATVAGGAAAAFDRNVVMTVLKLLIPKGSSNAALVVECAVVRLPFQRGVAAIDRSIAVETREVAIVARGEIDLARQTLALEFRPKVKKGLGLNPANFAELMMLSGPLQDPRVGFDAKGTVRSATSVGVAIATGGASLLAPMVLGDSEGGSACAEAARTAPAKATARTAPAAGDKAAPKARKRGLFGIR